MKSLCKILFVIVAAGLANTPISLNALICCEKEHYNPYECTDQFWIRGEYLLWNTKRTKLRTPLLTQASLSDPIPGAIGQPGTKVVLGKMYLEPPLRSGFKISGGYYFDSHRTFGIDGSYFLLLTNLRSKFKSTTGASGTVNYAVPVFDVTGNWGLNGVPGETIFLLTGPASNPIFAGTFGDFDLRTASRFHGEEINLTYSLLNYCGLTIVEIAGFRHFALKEMLTYKGNTGISSIFSQNFFNFNDRFRAYNDFYGPQIGFLCEYDRQDWLLSSCVKVGLGVMNKHVSIKGSSSTVGGSEFYLVTGPQQDLGSGIFAQKTNRGIYTKHSFGVTVDSTIRIGYRFTDYLETHIGYNFLWLNDVTPLARVIDHKINPTLTSLAKVSRSTAGTTVGPIPFGSRKGAEAPEGEKAPEFSFKKEHYWAQGLTIWITLRF